MALASSARLKGVIDISGLLAMRWIASWEWTSTTYNATRKLESIYGLNIALSPYRR
jgi:hypothetical protein